MTAIALTYAEGHPNHGEIIAWQRMPWDTPGEYTDPKFANCLFDCPEDMQPRRIVSFGEKTTATFDTWEGQIICNNVYDDCYVELEPVLEDL